VPGDVTGKGVSTSSNNTTPAATTGTLAGTGELSIAAACLGGLQGGTPNTPDWSAGYTNRLDGQTAGTGGTDQHLFVADNRNAGTAAESPNPSWTSNTNNQTLLVATFKPGELVTAELDAALPALTADLAGDVSAAAALAASLPPLTADLAGGLTAAGALSGSLPALAADLAGVVDTGVHGALDAALPALAGDLAGTLTVEVVLAGALPALVADFNGSTGARRVSGRVIGLPELAGGVSARVSRAIAGHAG
jgi:hypothetical protein